MNNIIIRESCKEDLHSIVEIHLLAFKSFFLSKLGYEFIYQYYQMYIDNHEIILVAVNDENKVVGFICGLENSNYFYKKMKSEWYRFISVKFVLNSFKLFKMVFKKIKSLFFINKINPINYPSCSNELTSISVIPEYSGCGVGKQLLTEYIHKVRNNKKSKNIVLTTDFYHNDNVINFYKKNGFNIYTDFCQSENRKMLVLIKKI
ncbi:GNAT family N-acetyltransferase [Photobacterium damselae]|uniref:GNAT family N-acetyltransferase n=1 Tax=Photobacterium damselae TaxID=38293 RepID=UPI00159F72EA|nr:GNAT family N-acetyltransferase [Photobacterium damselae]NVO60947.1 GNAT family N-acetyltransferase [Photobacterium damselae subsp. damselae]